MCNKIWKYLWEEFVHRVNSIFWSFKWEVDDIKPILWEFETQEVIDEKDLTNCISLF